MIRLALRTLRHRKGSFLAAFLTMFLGATIVMACGGLMETGIRGDVPPRQLDGADVVVAGDQQYEVPEMQYTAPMQERARIDAALVDAVAAVPGVREATNHTIDDPAPAGTVDAIAVVAEPGVEVDQLRALIEAEIPGGAVALVGDDRGVAEVPDAAIHAEGLVVLSGVFGSWAIMIAVFGVASMLALTIHQRRREMALLRAVGSTPGQLRALILGETVILSALATGLAILPARWLAEFLQLQMVRNGVTIDEIAFQMGWIPITIGIGSALLAAVCGAAVAGGAAARTRPTEALASAGLPERNRIGFWRPLLGVALLLGGIALCVVTMTVNSGSYASTTGSPAVIVMGIALAVLSPALTRPLAAALSPLGALMGQSGRLAMLNVRAGVDRTAAVAMPVILLTSISAGLLYMHNTGKDAVHQEYVDGLSSDAVVTAEGGVDGQLVDNVRDLPEVGEVSGYVNSRGFLEHPIDDPENWEGEARWDGWILEGVDPGGVGAVWSAPVTDGSADALSGATVAMDSGNAEELGLAVGDTLTVRMGDNAPLDVELVALFDVGGDDNTLLLPTETLAAHTTAGHATEILVSAADGTATDQMLAELEDFATGQAGVDVSSSEALADAYAENQDIESFAIYTIVVMIVTYSVISVVNTLASSTNARTREFAVQRLTGSTREQVMRMLSIESLLIAAIGIVLGTIAAVVPLVAFSVGRADTTQWTGSPWIYVTVVAGTVLVTLLATLLPAWQAVRRGPVDAAAS
ncbi:FtsX-like permease family protein [Spiractinospora alimapuensis]|uniref:ABC transporter permease n=1 Tax=Spiractinospora alimapuensis TaxID=2820884 RepID=UPI001F3BAB60|nr:FtsX-like permease family protein [Spiractinospora alimapuensis]QVQ54473.1 FtsX-like permease family protein [Spiractinospora alimapuensis]